MRTPCALTPENTLYRAGHGIKENELQCSEKCNSLIIQIVYVYYTLLSEYFHWGHG